MLTKDQAFKDFTNTKNQQRYYLKHSNNEEDGNLEERKSHHLTSLREKKKHCSFSIREEKGHQRGLVRTNWWKFDFWCLNSQAEQVESELGIQMSFMVPIGSSLRSEL